VESPPAAPPAPHRTTPSVRGGVRVRPAASADAAAVADVGVTAWRATYAGIVGADAIERFIAGAYTVARIESRIERDVMYVAGYEGGHPSGVDGFVEALIDRDHPHIVAFYTRPGARGRGLGTALLEAVVATYPGQDISADVLEGNELGEPFYRARGFEPGEVIEEDIAGELIRERRWWLRARQSAG
jgi:GNAT superfamily N-acetyltransferase